MVSGSKQLNRSSRFSADIWPPYSYGAPTLNFKSMAMGAPDKQEDVLVSNISRFRIKASLFHYLAIFKQPFIILSKFVALSIDTYCFDSA